VYCICPEQRQADAIEVLDLSKDDKIRYWNSKATRQKEEENDDFIVDAEEEKD